MIHGPGLPTCDWGDCDGEAVGVRRDKSIGWLPVCREHFDSAPPNDRIRREELSDDWTESKYWFPVG